MAMRNASWGIMAWVSRNRSYLVGITIGFALSPVIVWFDDAVGWTDRHQGLASWVQAIGTIVALGIAVWVPWRIHLREQSIAAMPRQRKLLMLKDALGAMQWPIGYFQAMAAEFPDDSIKDANVEVVAEQMWKAITLYLIAEAELPAIREACAGEVFEATPDIERLQAAMAKYRSMIFAEEKGLHRYKRSAKVVAICLQKVGDAFSKVDPLLERAIERFVY